MIAAVFTGQSLNLTAVCICHANQSDVFIACLSLDVVNHMCAIYHQPFVQALFILISDYFVRSGPPFSTLRSSSLLFCLVPSLSRPLSHHMSAVPPSVTSHVCCPVLCPVWDHTPCVQTAAPAGRRGQPLPRGPLGGREGGRAAVDGPVPTPLPRTGPADIKTRH